MLGKHSSFAVLIAATLVVANADAACNRCEPIKNVIDTVVATGSGKEPSSDDVKTAIVHAGAVHGWKVRDAGPGKLVAVLQIRVHTAEVEIPYSTFRAAVTSSREERGFDAQRYTSAPPAFSVRIRFAVSAVT